MSTITVYIQNGEVQYVSGIPDSTHVRVIRQDQGGEIADTSFWLPGGYYSRELQHVTYPDDRRRDDGGHESVNL